MQLKYNQSLFLKILSFVNPSYQFWKTNSFGYFQWRVHLFNLNNKIKPRTSIDTLIIANANEIFGSKFKFIILCPKRTNEHSSIYKIISSNDLQIFTGFSYTAVNYNILFTNYEDDLLVLKLYLSNITIFHYDELIIPEFKR